ncbi:MAG: type II secretion system protein [Pseudomonadota bacterium]
MKSNIKYLKAFSLIEILIVITIVGILFGFGLNQYTMSIGKNSFRSAKNELMSLRADMEARSNIERKYIDLIAENPNKAESEDGKYSFAIVFEDGGRNYKVTAKNEKNGAIKTCLTFEIDKYGTGQPASCWE